LEYKMKRIEKVQMLNIELEKECTALLAQVHDLQVRLARHETRAVIHDEEAMLDFLNSDGNTGAGAPKDLVDVINSLKNQDLDTAYERRFNNDVFDENDLLDTISLRAVKEAIYGDKDLDAPMEFEYTIPTDAPVDAGGVKLEYKDLLHESGGGPLGVGEFPIMGGGKMPPREALRKGIITLAEYNELMGTNT
jgi:hypothetical protein